jgi:serine/threonine protein kinase
LHKIFKLCGSPSEEYWIKSKLPHATIFKPQQPYKRCIMETFKEFPSSSLALLDTLLAIEPADRGSAAEALKSDFFNTKPLPCDPSNLPHYPPSKEFDTKFQDDEGCRKRPAGRRVRGSDASNQPGTQDGTSQAIGAPDANAELAITLHKRRMNPQAATKSKSEKFPPLQKDGTVAFSRHPPVARQPFTEVKGISPVQAIHSYAVPSISSQSGPELATNASLAGNSLKKKKHKGEDMYMASSRPLSRPTKSMTVTEFSQAAYPQQPANLSSISMLVAARNGANGNHYGGWDSRRAQDSDVIHYDGEVNRQSERRDMHRMNEMLSKQERTYKHDQLSARTTYSPSRWDSSTVDSCQTDGNHLSKLPSKGIHSQQEQMYHSGPLLHPAYFGSGSVDYEEFLEEHEHQIQQGLQQAPEDMKTSHKSMSACVDKKHKSKMGGSACKHDSEIVEVGNGFGHRK